MTLRELFCLSGHTNFVLEGMISMEKFSSEETRIKKFYPKLKIDPHNLPNLEVFSIKKTVIKYNLMI